MRKDYEILGIDENADEKAIKRAYFKLIRTYSPEKDPEHFQEIRSAYERLLEAKEQPENSISLEFPADDKFAVSMFDQIQQLMQEGDYDKAVKTAEEGLKYYHNMECFLYMYARCSMLNGNAGKAVKAYEKLVQRYPDKIYYMSELAKAYYIRGYMRKAYSMFQKAYGEGARDAEFLLQYSLCCFKKGMHDESLQALESLIDSIPPEKMNGRIPELLEAYSGAFTLYLASDFSLTKVVNSCNTLLDQVGSQIHDYDEMLMQVYIIARVVSNQDGGDEIAELVDKIKLLLPDIFDEEDLIEVQEAYELMEDDRFSQLMKNTIKAFMLLDDLDFPGESFDEYAEFMQLDAFLCQLEEWPKQRKELELLRREYPNVYDCGTDVWDMLKESKGRKAVMIESVLAEYVKMERLYRCGHYYELYPNRRQDMEQVQWDSQGSGTYMRQGKKIGRNDPCPCGSGKKYKNCCGK